MFKVGLFIILLITTVIVSNFVSSNIYALSLLGMVFIGTIMFWSDARRWIEKFGKYFS